MNGASRYSDTNSSVLWEKMTFSLCQIVILHSVGAKGGV